jgi:uncharacterized phage-associated protein
MSYCASMIANYFLKKAKQAGEHLSPMKLLKLVYFAHGWNLAIKDQSLLKEPVEAWPYGPVISSLYHQFKKFGNEAITESASVDEKEIQNLESDFATQALLNNIWSVYSKYTAVQLSNLSHEKGSPWDKAWHDEDGRYNYHHVISDEIIKNYYLQQIKSQPQKS